jgi:hypothetical protein
MMFGRMVKIGHAVVVRAAVWGGMGIWEWWMTRREVDGALVRWWMRRRLCCMEALGFADLRFEGRER